ncbi:hypothetical protein [Pantoea allii]
MTTPNGTFNSKHGFENVITDEHSKFIIVMTSLQKEHDKFSIKGDKPGKI